MNRANEGHLEAKVTTLLDVPELPVLCIASFLEWKDLLNFSRSCRKIFHICEHDKMIWRKVYGLSFPFYKEIADAASTLVAKDESVVTNPEKLACLMHASTRQNWLKGSFVRRADLCMGQKTQSREGVGSLRSVGRGASAHKVFHYWDVKSGTSKTFLVNAPQAAQMLSQRPLDRSIVVGSVLILQISRLDSENIDLVALKLDDSNHEVRPWVDFINNSCTSFLYKSASLSFL
jgi:hypothetical protein